MKYLFLIALVALSGCTSLSSINHRVNSYGYKADTPEEDKQPPAIMSPTMKGDCEDHAVTKCLMILEHMPDTKLSYLYRTGSQMSRMSGGKYKQAHAALLAGDMVLDNMQSQPYPYNRADWLYAAPWSDCKAIDLLQAVKDMRTASK